MIVNRRYKLYWRSPSIVGEALAKKESNFRHQNHQLMKSDRITTDRQVN